MSSVLDSELDDAAVERPHDSSTLDPSSRRVIIVSNRLPLTLASKEGRLIVRSSVGGLATGLRAPHERAGGLWIGWPGRQLATLSPQDREVVDKRFSELRVLPVSLTEQEVEVFYERIANAVLWPLFHDRIDQVPLRISGWEAYEAVNERFADAVASQYREGDLIWVHDYQLLRLPALIRQRVPKARIGFFLHIPFPNPEIFFVLARRRWLLEGMLGADVIGFHTARYRGHFTAALRRLLGKEAAGTHRVEHEGREVSIGVFPMGIDATDIATRSTARPIAIQTDELRAGPQRLLLGIDRLDYSKGIPRRLLAFERLLIDHPEWRERVRLVQVAVPSREGVTAYRRVREEVNGLVGRINGAFGTPSWTPIQHLVRSMAQDTLLALYRAADVMLVTPVRDGMNLVAKEFVASRTDEDGVLLLSEFAGAADELSDAVVVNPYDVDGVAEHIHEALTMPAAERRQRMQAMRARIFRNDVHRWTETFLEALNAVG
jgi:trehalose 6-phosphate synthase/phosphatase